MNTAHTQQIIEEGRRGGGDQDSATPREVGGYQPLGVAQQPALVVGREARGSWDAPTRRGVPAGRRLVAHSRRRPPSSHQSYARIIGRDARWRALKGGTARPSRQTAGARIPRLAGVETPNPTRPAADTCGPAAAAAGAAAGAHSTWRSKNLLAASTADQSTRAQVSQSSRRAGPPVGCQGGGGARRATRGERAVAAPVPMARAIRRQRRWQPPGEPRHAARRGSRVGGVPPPRASADARVADAAAAANARWRPPPSSRGPASHARLRSIRRPWSSTLHRLP